VYFCGPTQPSQTPPGSILREMSPDFLLERFTRVCSIFLPNILVSNSSPGCLPVAFFPAKFLWFQRRTSNALFDSAKVIQTHVWELNCILRFKSSSARSHLPQATDSKAFQPSRPCPHASSLQLPAFGLRRETLYCT
jgi:hypothetical protein